MADTIAVLREDLAEQFKGMPNIEALCSIVDKQLQDVADFFQQLKDERCLRKAVGANLDGVGNIVDMSRSDAASLLRESVISDEAYRDVLVYKIMKNTNACTYYELVQGISMFCDDPVFYQESDDYPATIILKVTAETAIALERVPFIKAAGVTMMFSVNDSTATCTLIPVFGYWMDDTIIAKMSITSLE